MSSQEIREPQKAKRTIGMGEPDPIERVDRPTREVFKREFEFRSRPVIVTGTMRGWKALSSWTVEYLRSAAGNVPVMVHASAGGSFAGDPKKGFRDHVEEMTFGEYLRAITSEIRSAERLYLRQVPIAKRFPGLARDIAVPDYIEKRHLGPVNLWISSLGVVSPLHYDTMQNFHAVIRGRKRFLLFSPAQVRYLYPYPVRSAIPHCSRIVEVEKPDLERFPAFRQARALEGTLEPGEMLFIPAGWWHQVEHSGGGEVTMAVNFWWLPRIRDWWNPCLLRVLHDVVREKARHVGRRHYQGLRALIPGRGATPAPQDAN